MLHLLQLKTDNPAGGRVRPPSSPPQHVEDRASSRDHTVSHATATGAARKDILEWSGRDKRCNMENKVPDAFQQHRSNLPPVQLQQQQEQSSWRKLKKLDHHKEHLHPRQISPSRVAAAPVAVVVESGPLSTSDGGAGASGRPYKRSRNVSSEEDPDNDSLNTSAHSSRGGSFYAYSGSPDSVASSRRRSITSSSPLSRAGLGFYLGAPMIDSSPPSAAATATDVAAAITATNGGYSSVTDHNQHHHSHHEWNRQQTSRPVGFAGGGVRHDEDAAAVAVLGLRNGHASAAASAAVAATQPPAVPVPVPVVRSMRGQEVLEHAQAHLPAAVNIVRTGGGAAGSATTTTHGGGGDVAGGQSSVGALQWAGKR